MDRQNLGWAWLPGPLLLKGAPNNLTMATSAWKICFTNLFREEWTSWMMSPWRVSRFFSRKPGNSKEQSWVPVPPLGKGSPNPQHLSHKDPQDSPRLPTAIPVWAWPGEDSGLPTITEKMRSNPPNTPPTHSLCKKHRRSRSQGETEATFPTRASLSHREPFDLRRQSPCEGIT